MFFNEWFSPVCRDGLESHLHQNCIWVYKSIYSLPEWFTMAVFFVLFFTSLFIFIYSFIVCTLASALFSCRTIRFPHIEPRWAAINDFCIACKSRHLLWIQSLISHCLNFKQCRLKWVSQPLPSLTKLLLSNYANMHCSINSHCITDNICSLKMYLIN